MTIAIAATTGACKKDNKVSVTNTSNPCEGADAGPEAIACGGACVDLQTSAAHCGQCDNACPAGGVCTDGTCGCPAGQSVCGGACVDTNVDLKNCGTCSNACSTGATCTDGECRCPGTRGAVCMGECADLDSDSSHCGQCGTACTGGTTCTAGTCACALANEKSCGATCIDIQSDALNCGDCNNRCDPGANCDAGECRCPGAMGKVCGTACVDTATSAAHCGDCDRPCDRLCIGGACPTVAEVAAGAGHTCARLSTGAVACWGQNQVGQLGDGDMGSPRYSPGVVTTSATAAYLAAGGPNTCMISTMGELWCWGGNDELQLTDGAAEFEPAPFHISSYPTGEPLDRLAVGGRFTCAGGSGSGSAYCWGANSYGESGATPSLAVGQPTKIQDVVDVETLSAGFTHGCAVVRDPGNFGKVLCWGDNRGGLLGVDPVTVAYSTSGLPLDTPLGNAVGVFAGGNGACALDAVGQAWCWGNGWLTGQADGHTPVMIAGLPNATIITGENEFACTRVTGGEIWCWGADFSGSTGQEPPSSTPAAVLDGTGAKLSGMDGVVAGASHTCAWTPTAIHCWGDNEFGQLGNGDGGTGKKSARAVRVVW